MSKDNENEPIYYKAWFLITCVIGLVLLFSIITGVEPTEKPFVISEYNNMSLEQQKSSLNHFVSDRKSKLIRLIEAAVLKNLKAPSDAEFINDMQFSVDQYSSRQIMARGTVDASNSFGVKIRVSYRCRFAIANNDGDIEIQEVAIDE